MVILLLGCFVFVDICYGCGVEVLFLVEWFDVYKYFVVVVSEVDFVVILDLE